MSTIQERMVLEPVHRHADDLSIEAILFENRVFHLRKPFKLHFQFDDGLCVCGFEPLGILAHGETVQEAFDAFQAEFAACWDGIAQRDDRHLTDDAQSLKKQFLKLVATIQLLS